MDSGNGVAPAEILLVEDNLDDAFLFLRAFKKRFPAAVLSAVESTEAAVRYLSGMRQGACTVPAAIFVDLNLPGRAGNELLDSLGAEPLLRNTRLVVLSGTVSQIGRRLDQNGRELLYLPKPLSSASVLAAVGDLFGSVSLAGELQEISG
jgi:CheY-like chemotaxis protein